ncbi:LOW QUALITY PROTEIN: hypothetical protein CVT25_014697, partial [Psilocybe cyanescens]
IYYDKHGELRAVGVEAKREGIEADAEDKAWPKAEWQVLFITSKIVQTSPAPPKPQLCVDCQPCHATSSRREDGHRRLRRLSALAPPMCADIYRGNTPQRRRYNLETRTDFVLTHPNGWEGTQQSQTRRAAVRVGLIPNSPAGQQRLSFVTEGEANFTSEGLTTHAMEQGKGILVVDAGGGTIDITAYKRSSQDIQSFEVVAPQCMTSETMFTTQLAYELPFSRVGLRDQQGEELPRESKTRFMDDIPNITECFDKGTKLRFDNDDDAQYIKFGRRADKDPLLNIRSGQLKLLGGIDRETACGFKDSNCVFLIGGFAASDWLFVNLKARLSDDTLDICRPDSHVNKAVADGAISFYLDRFVGARVSKYAYGTNLCPLFNPEDPEHIARLAQKIIQLDGRTLISGAYDVILPKNIKVSEVEEYRDSYCRQSEDTSKLQSVTSKIRCYRGTKSNPRWVDEDPDIYSTLCLVTADTPKLPMRTYFRGNSESVYYQVLYDIILSFGLTELKAQIVLKDSNFRLARFVQV